MTKATFTQSELLELAGELANEVGESPGVKAEFLICVAETLRVSGDGTLAIFVKAIDDCSIAGVLTSERATQWYERLKLSADQRARLRQKFSTVFRD